MATNVNMGNRIINMCHALISRTHIVVLLLLMIGTIPAEGKKKIASKKDTLQLKIDSIQQAFTSIKINYDKENEKAYLKQKYDTAKLFNLTRQMFSTLAELDSADVKKNAKPKFRKKNGELLNGYRRNLFNGGNYYLRRNKYEDAFMFYEDYIVSASMPMLAQYDYLSTDTLMPRVAFWSMVAGSLQHKPEEVLKYSDLAYNWVRQEQVLQFKANAYRELNKDEDYEATLMKGFTEFPGYVFFFNNLVALYSDKGRLEEGLKLCNEALKLDVAVQPENKQTFRYAKSGFLLKEKKWDECIVECEQLIVEDSTFAMPYYNAGLCYLNKAEPLTRKEKKEKKSLLNISRKYLETYRDMKPQEKDKWAPLLYRVYFNLNLGKHFKDMERKM